MSDEMGTTFREYLAGYRNIIYYRMISANCDL